MGKFKDTQDNIYSIFSSNTWQAENIKTFPSNFLAVNQGNEFIKISVLLNESPVNFDSISGVLIIDIFTSAGNGTNNSMLIADKLDTYLVGKSITTVTGKLTQFLKSSFSLRGLDTDNPTLFRSSYSIPFNHFGV